MISTRTTPPINTVRRSARTNGMTLVIDRHVVTNAMLALGALGLLVFYVVQVNLGAAASWRLKDAQSRFTAVRQEHDTLVAQQVGQEDRTVLQGVAKTYGLVPADAVTYIIEHDAVATAR